MKYISVNKKLIATASFLGVSMVLAPQTFAEQIVIEISGNGSGASSEVQLNSESQTQVTQTNEMDVNNNVDTNVNTGGNQADSNTGDVTIVTGDAEANVDISNSGNHSHVDTGCCEGSGSGLIKISGNGSGSLNSVNANVSQGVHIDIHNSANLTNNVNGKVVTGKNDANYNLGDVLIKTGSIVARETITNGVFNVSNVSVGIKELDFSIKIADNAAHSKNLVELDQTTEHAVNIENSFNVVNDSSWELITGENSASGNLGDVLIATGDIYYESVITNTGNISHVEISCCPDPAVPTTPVNPPPPTTTVNQGGGGGVGSSSGSSGGSSDPGLGGILPATGANFFFLFLLLNMMFFMFGVFMKLRGGRSPAFAYAV